MYILVQQHRTQANAVAQRCRGQESRAVINRHGSRGQVIHLSTATPTPGVAHGSKLRRNTDHGRLDDAQPDECSVERVQHLTRWHLMQ